MRGLAAIVIALAMAAGGSLAARQNTDSAAQPARRTVWDGLYSEPQAVRGKAAYMKACAECHAADLGGHEYAGRSPDSASSSSGRMRAWRRSTGACAACRLARLDR